jgi:AraC family transcriptional regulator
MPLVIHHLGHGASLEAAAASWRVGGAPAVAIVRGGGRGCSLRIEGPVLGFWLPLRGRLQLGPAAEIACGSGELRACETEPRVRAVGRGAAIWLAVLGSPAAWRMTLAGWPGVPIEPLLLPAVHGADRATRIDALALARCTSHADAEPALDAVLDRVLALQSGFDAAIARCPGRTWAQRRQVFLRLQRVRNYVATHCHLDLDNDALAAMANYSSWHFIRAFRSAYGETPHAYLVRMRLEHARRLLRTSPLAIAEIALASGFENRCAFSRLFRQHFGTTAGALRRQSSVPLAAAG